MKLYRYEDKVYSTVSISPSGHESYGTTYPKLQLTELNVVRETALGWTVEARKYRLFNERQTRWVKRVDHAYGYAYPTQKQALRSFIARKGLEP